MRSSFRRKWYAASVELSYMYYSFLTWMRLVTSFPILRTAAVNSVNNSFSQRVRQTDSQSVIKSKSVRQAVATYVIQQCVIFCLTAFKMQDERTWYIVIAAILSAKELVDAT